MTRKRPSMIATIRTAIALAVAAFATSVLAQQVVYPAKKQSAEQQKKDESQCHQWAVQNTGIDPSKQAAAPPPPTTATGTQRGAGARGAARGAVVGEIVADDASTAAAAGAGAARGRRRRAHSA